MKKAPRRARASKSERKKSSPSKTPERRVPVPVPLDASVLRWRCDPKRLPYDSTEQTPPITGVVGQDAAIDALRFGLETTAPGQNVFIRGIIGTGRMTLVRRLLEEIRLACPAARDRCYVHNFSQPDRPHLITLLRGQGHAFAERVDELADYIRDDLKAALASEPVVAKRRALEQKTQKQVDQIVEPFEAALAEAGLALVSFQTGAVVQSALFPRVDGKPVPPDEYEQLRTGRQVSEQDYAHFREQHDAFQDRLADVTAKVNELRGTHAKAALELWKDEVRAALSPIAAGIAEEFPAIEVRSFLQDVIDDVVNRRRRAIEKEADFTRVYRVNVVLSHGNGAGCPIIVENTPTMSNLLGTIEHSFSRAEGAHSDHLMVRAGSLLRADGGYIVLDARDVLREPGAWATLVRTLRTRRLEIVPPELVFPYAGPSLKPEPIDVNLKVILLGDAELYYMLDEADPDFPELFKVLADFDSVIPRDDVGIDQYCGVIARLVKEEALPHFDRTALAALIEHGARIAANAGKLSTRFGRLADIAREAVFVASKTFVRPITGNEVREAIRRGRSRADLPSRRFREMIADGTIRIETSGALVGQINGLAVITAGPLSYGFPARITATIGPGTAGVINIEREAALSGAIHTKGFYILGGLLRYLLRTIHPLAFDASVALEQSYGGIDGDSASGAEMCCLLSALTDIPIRQDLAMTGAIDQVGHILAIGAVTEKIEGFYDVCRDVGLTGTQGVLIPKSNAGDLMLREDVVEACAAGRFSVYAVDNVLDALEILTGVPAGQRGKRDAYPQGSLLAKAMDRAWLYWLKASQRMDVPMEPEEHERVRAARAAKSKRGAKRKQ